MTPPIGRVLTAMITPFDADGAVDHATAWDLAAFLVANGTDGIVAFGSTGESATLDSDEKIALLRTVVDAVGDKAQVIAGTGTYDTAASVRLTERAIDAGATGIMAVTPYYSRPPQNGLVAHFTAIADASSLPVMLYNIPSRTARLIEVPTLAHLAEHERIVAVKDAVGDVAFTSDTIAACGDAITVYCGDDALTVPMMAVGAVGVVSVASHLAGRQIAAMVSAAAAGDWDRARELHVGLTPLFQSLFIEPNPMPLKAAMSVLWQPVGDPRLPLVPAAPETVKAVEEALAAAPPA